MKQRALHLLHPFFLLSLAVLLLNDLYWKYQFANAFTGKLSDCSGLLAFSVFLHLFLERKKLVILVSGLFFIWWKSPLSEPLIGLLNEWLPVNLGRVIDYTDLFSLLVLPCIYLIKPVSWLIPLKNLTLSFVAVLSLFAFCHTSVLKNPIAYNRLRENESRVNWAFSSRLTESLLLKRLDSLQIPYHEEVYRYYPVTEQQLYYRLRQKDSARYVRLRNTADSSLFVRIESPKFYVIPVYVISGDTLRNIEFIFEPVGKKKIRGKILVYAYWLDPGHRDQDHSTYRKHFKELFE